MWPLLIHPRIVSCRKALGEDGQLRDVFRVEFIAPDGQPLGLFCDGFPWDLNVLD